MATDLTPDLRGFHEFLGEKLKTGVAVVSPEEALDEWRALHPSPEELAEGAAAVKQALAEVAAGDKGRPVDQVLADIRRELRLAADE